MYGQQHRAETRPATNLSNRRRHIKQQLRRGEEKRGQKRNSLHIVSTTIAVELHIDKPSQQWIMQLPRIVGRGSTRAKSSLTLHETADLLLPTFDFPTSTPYTLIRLRPVVTIWLIGWCSTGPTHLVSILRQDSRHFSHSSLTSKPYVITSVAKETIALNSLLTTTNRIPKILYIVPDIST